MGDEPITGKPKGAPKDSAPEARRYTLAELREAAPALLGCSRVAFAGALALDESGREEMTAADARKMVDAFAKREVPV